MIVEQYKFVGVVILQQVSKYYKHLTQKAYIVGSD